MTEAAVPAQEFHHGKAPTGPAGPTEFLSCDAPTCVAPLWATRRQVGRWLFLHWRWVSEHADIAPCPCALTVPSAPSQS